MWPVERFAVPGPPTGAGNMLRCLHWLKPPRTFRLYPALLVLCVRIIVGVGMIGCYVMLGRDLRNGASLLLASLLFSPSNNRRRKRQTQGRFQACAISL